MARLVVSESEEVLMAADGPLRYLRAVLVGYVISFGGCDFVLRMTGESGNDN